MVHERVEMVYPNRLHVVLVLPSARNIHPMETYIFFFKNSFLFTCETIQSTKINYLLELLLPIRHRIHWSVELREPQALFPSFSPTRKRTQFFFVHIESLNDKKIIAMTYFAYSFFVPWQNRYEINDFTVDF